MNENINQFKEIFFDTIDSTQIYARKYIEENEINDTWIVIRSKQQTNGIGQHNRKWVSPLGNLYTTFIIPMDFNYKLLSHLSVITSLSICETLESLGYKPMIKWVNDIMINSHKIAGSLSESITYDKLYVIIGIGININMKEENIYDINQPATSLLIEGNIEVNIELVYNILRERLYYYITNGEKNDLMEKYDYRLLNKNEKVKILDKTNNEFEGILRGIDDNGFIKIEIDNKELKKGSRTSK